MISSLTIRRPVSVAMFFLGIALVGIVGWQRMPVELFPALQGDRLFVNFLRPGSEPEVVEREILIPLQAAVSALPFVADTYGEVRGSSGRFEVRFDQGTDVRIRALDLQRVVSDLGRTQPEGTYIGTASVDTSVISSFVMQIHVLGGTGEDVNALREVVEELIAPRFAAITGVSQVIATGGAPRQVSLTVDPARLTALGVTNDQVTAAMRRNAGRLQFVGNLEDGSGRTAVMVDARPQGVHALGEARIARSTPARLRHVGELAIGSAREESRFRVNGQPAVGLVIFQEQGANLVRLGRALRGRVMEMREELNPLGLDLVVGFDGSDTVESQINHLGKLGLSGFAVALVVLFFFLREWRAVAVVGVAVPMSLLTALSFLYLLGLSLNLITLFGLALAIGLVIDNSVVVYESVQHGLERGTAIEDAIGNALRRTLRAIVAASATTAVVFLPLALVDFDDALTAKIVQVVALSIVLPLAASLVVAIGLVPLLAHHLAAPAVARRVREARLRRAGHAGLVAPNPFRVFFTAVVAAALRHPPAWLAGTGAAVMLTVLIALPWVMVNSSGQEEETDTVQFAMRFSGDSIESASGRMERIERALLALDGIDRIEASMDEDSGSLVVRLRDADERPISMNAARVRRAVREAAKQDDTEVLRPGEEALDGRGGGSEEVFGGSARQIVVSGPDTLRLDELAETLRAQLESMPQVQSAWKSTRPGLEELWIEPIARGFESLGLTLNDILPVLGLIGREGERLPNGFILEDGRELPLLIVRAGARDRFGGNSDFARMRVHTQVGPVPVATLAEMRRMPAPPIIRHHNGRRETSVFYRLSPSVPETGPDRVRVEEEIATAIRATERPLGFTVETAALQEPTEWIREILLPVVLLLFLVMALTFESLTLPVLVLISLPLTLLGATWALAVAGMSLGIMAALGALALIGLTVNPAILLVDRMQQLVLGGGFGAGAAAFAAVRERTRPVLMTTATTVAGLWPLAISTGAENEIWPPFATIVIGGLVTSGLLTLLIIPVGFILLRRLDDLFGRVGPWLVLTWLAAVAAIMAALILTGTITSLLWQAVVTVLVGGALLAMVVIAFRRTEIPEPESGDGPPVLEVRHLYKVYGLPGPLQKALLAPRRFAEKVLQQGGVVFDAARTRSRLLPLLLSVGGIGYLAVQFDTPFWMLAMLLVASVLLIHVVRDIRRLRGFVAPSGAVLPGGFENVLAAAIPWLVLAGFAWFMLAARLAAGVPTIAMGMLIALFAAIIGIVQGARRSARRQAQGSLPEAGVLRTPRRFWRRIAKRTAGLDVAPESKVALGGVGFRVERGMVGILGPNGAGKTTLLRQLAGVLDSTRGTIRLGGVPYGRIRRYLARWVGYLPQDAGLPGAMSAREYLEYFAVLYEIDRSERARRVTDLIEEVGLADKADDPIGSLSGGMRQRVAVARTLLRLPPVIIVDEPTVGLDPRERIRFRNLLGRLARDRIVLFSTHVVEDVAVACERVLVLARGRLLFDGEPAALAEIAEGRAWEVRTTTPRELNLPPDAIDAEESPMADGGIVHRVLAPEQPRIDGDDIEVRPLEPTLEDGYMLLVHDREGDPEDEGEGEKEDKGEGDPKDKGEGEEKGKGEGENKDRGDGEP